MERQYITDTSYSGLRLMGARGYTAVDTWENLDTFIRNELGDKDANLLAEPENLGGGSYSWFSAWDGQANLAKDLGPQAYEKVCHKAASSLAKLKDLAERSKDASDRQVRLFGEILWAAITIPEERLEHSLYCVDGNPVFVNWGARIDRPEYDGAGPLVVSTKTVAKPIEPKKDYLYQVINALLWLVFIAVCGFIHVKLIDGCGMFGAYNLGPLGHCELVVEASESLESESMETMRLQNEFLALQNRALDNEYCDIAGAQNSVSNSPSNNSTSNQDDDTFVPKAGKQLVADHLLLNSLLDEAKAATCSGVEVFAIWNDAVDIDLVLYPITPTDEINPDLLVDPYNTKTEYAVMDVSNDGSTAQESHMERICISEDAEFDKYLASVYNNGDKAVQGVKLLSRGGDLIDQLEIDVAANSEYELGLNITLQD